MLGGRVELKECVLHELVDLHYCCLVSAPVAVIWRGKHGDYIAVMRPVVAVHDELVCTRYQFEIVRVVELF